MRFGNDGFEAFFVTVVGRAVDSAERVLGDRGDAEDAAVEALARAHLRWGRLRDDPHREAWVLRVAINVAIDQQRQDRRRLRRHERLTNAVVVPAFDGGTVDRLDLARALHDLPARQREAVALRYLADMSECEVAAAMGVTVGSIKVHLHRGLQSLGRRLPRIVTEEAADARA
jgi:RNA polymerase sigma factor (sigma-70 family)